MNLHSRFQTKEPQTISIYRLTAQIESLDQRCEELQRSLDDMTVQQESARRRQRRSLTTPDTPVAPTSLPQAPSLPPVTSTVDEEEVRVEAGTFSSQEGYRYS